MVMVVYVFSDIEGSTRLWSDHPEAMGPALERHDELITESFPEHDGTIFKHTGDGLVAWFASPRSGLIDSPR